MALRLRAALQAIPEPRSALDEAEAVLDRARRSAREPMVIEETTIRTSISGGLAVAGPGSQPDLLLRDADAAMYAAKKLGGDLIAMAPVVLGLWYVSAV